jgi:hypothetical protein
VKDARKRVWDQEIKSLNEELDAIPDLSGTSNSEVHTHDTSSPVENTVMKRLRLENEIERRENYKKIFNTALEDLTDDEREVFEGFWMYNKFVSRFVDDYTNEHGCSPRHVYDLKRQSERQFCENIMAQKGNYPNF